jgi:hypothetical protein
MIKCKMKIHVAAMMVVKQVGRWLEMMWRCAKPQNDGKVSISSNFPSSTFEHHFQTNPINDLHINNSL